MSTGGKTIRAVEEEKHIFTAVSGKMNICGEKPKTLPSISGANSQGAAAAEKQP